MTCESDAPFMEWMLLSFFYTEYSNANYLTTNGEINSYVSGSFAIDHQPGTEVFTLVVLNSTISPSDGLNFSTAGFHQCYNYVTDHFNTAYAAAHLVVISKYELT